MDRPRSKGSNTWFSSSASRWKPAVATARLRSLSLALVGAFAAALLVGCGSPDWPERFAEAYEQAEPVREAPDLTVAEAMEVQRRFLQQIRGEEYVAGYKAGLTSAAVQETFGTDEPIRGTLLPHMLIRSGDTLEATFGARPRAEGDLMVRVGSDAINEAESDSALLAGLDAVVPFFELPDLMYAEEVSIGGAALAAVNVGARRGVVGPATPLPPGRAGYELLGGIRVEVFDRSGRVLADGRSSQLLGHPLEVVRWVRNSLREEGRRLEPGQLISLGSVTDLLAVQAGETLTARYFGAGTDTVELSVTFQ